MILGLGTDICDIRRIEKSIEKFGDKFLAKTFTEFERTYCDSKSGKASYYAKRFAAKEAVAKALSRGDTGALHWPDVEVRNDPSGRPTVRLYGSAKRRLEQNTPDGQHADVHLSLSDDYPYAVAFAIIEAN